MSHKLECIRLFHMDIHGLDRLSIDHTFDYYWMDARRLNSEVDKGSCRTEWQKWVTEYLPLGIQEELTFSSSYFMSPPR